MSKPSSPEGIPYEDPSSVTLKSGEVVTCGQVLNASGPRAARTAHMAGIDIPVEPRKRYSWIFSADKPLDRDLPVTIDPSGVHVRENGGGTYQCGGHSEFDPAVDYDDFTMDHSMWENHVWPILATRNPQAVRLSKRRSSDETCTKPLYAHALRAGNKQIGLWISLCSNFVAEVTAHAGYDWALIDMEHSPNDYFSVLGQMQAFAASDTTAIVRVEWNDPVAVKRLLDLGAPGLLFPMIQSVEEARKAVAATRYPPQGVRGVSGATRATKFGRVTDYVERVEDETTILLQLETRHAVEQAEAIADVDGIHGIFF